MRSKEFYLRVCNCKVDLISKFLEILEEEAIPYCVIGGLAINAYCEPIVTLDFDCVVAIDKVDKLKEKLKAQGVKVKTHPRTWEVTHKDTDIKIQIQRDERYQEFIKNASLCEVLGYKIKVAQKEDLLWGKIWAYQDRSRDELKRDKDLLDIKRLIKKYPNLQKLLPPKPKFEKIKNYGKIKKRWKL